MMTRQEKSIIMDLTNTEIATIDPEHIKIKSMGKKHDYIITLDNRGLAISCTCNDFTFRGHLIGSCKHMIYINNLIM